MARFRYRLQVALDDASACERAARVAFAGAERALENEEAALAALRAHATKTRAELVHGGSVPASMYVEVGLRLTAIARAENERTARIARAARAVAEARALLADRSQRRKAIERHRERARDKFDALEALREAADFDESNNARNGDVIRA